MPNIALTSYCNLHCPYCFANTMINTEQEKNISINQLNKILNWLNFNKKNKQRIGLIGGEPTLHPQINEILNIINKFCEKNNSFSILFTNGICLNSIIDNLPNNIKILININTPNAMTKTQFKQLNQNLNQISEFNWLQENKDNKVTLGCNICQQINDYSFFWNIIDNYSEIKRIRISTVAPISKKMLENKEEYYNSLKEKFLDFILKAEKRNITLGLDCNQIPKCFFTKQELKLIEKNCDQRNIICHPVVDITPDFKASACFGAYDTVDCNQFPNYESLYNYLLFNKTWPLIQNNIQGKCATCKEHEILNCQGGCLAFANQPK